MIRVDNVQFVAAWQDRDNGAVFNTRGGLEWGLLFVGTVATVAAWSAAVRW